MADSDVPPPNPSPPPYQYPPPAWPPPPGGYYAPPPPQFPPVNATLILIFGILGIVFSLFCIIGGVFGPIAWIMGNTALAMLDQTGDPWRQRGIVTAGRICGIVGTGLMAFMFLLFVAAMAFGIISGIRHPSGGILTP